MLKKEEKRCYAKKGGLKMICRPAKGCIKMPLGKCTGGAVIDLFLFHFPFSCTRTLYVSYIKHTIMYTRYTQYTPAVKKKTQASHLAVHRGAM